MLDLIMNPFQLVTVSFAAMVLGGVVFALLLPGDAKSNKMAVIYTVMIFAVPALLFAGVTLSVQGAKSEALARNQANLVNSAIQSETALSMVHSMSDDWKISPIVDTALSDDLSNGFSTEDISRLNAGETITVTSHRGKKVELSLESGTEDGRVNVVLKYDGERVESDSLNGFKVSSKVGTKSWESSWIDDYPTLVKAPAVGKSA